MGANSGITVVKQYRTHDGKMHNTKAEAETHMGLLGKIEAMKRWAENLSDHDPGVTLGSGSTCAILADDLPEFFCAHRRKILDLLNGTPNEDM